MSKPPDIGAGAGPVVYGLLIATGAGAGCRFWFDGDTGDGGSNVIGDFSNAGWGALVENCNAC